MELVFPWPMSQGEWLAWASAAVTVLFGLVLFFAPHLAFRLLRLETRADHPEAIAQGRATMAGFYLGLGFSAILSAQPWVYMALGLSWLLAAFGRLVSILSDRGMTSYNFVVILVELVLCILPLGFFLELWA